MSMTSRRKRSPVAGMRCSRSRLPHRGTRRGKSGTAGKNRQLIHQSGGRVRDRPFAGLANRRARSSSVKRLSGELGHGQCAGHLSGGAGRVPVGPNNLRWTGGKPRRHAAPTAHRARGDAQQALAFLLDVVEGDGPGICSEAHRTIASVARRQPERIDRWRLAGPGHRAAEWLSPIRFPPRRRPSPLGG